MDNWMWAQWTMAILIFLGVVSNAIMHGESKKGKYSFPVALVSAFISTFILWKGGFWK